MFLTPAWLPGVEPTLLPVKQQSADGVLCPPNPLPPMRLQLRRCRLVCRQHRTGPRAWGGIITRHLGIRRFSETTDGPGVEIQPVHQERRTSGRAPLDFYSELWILNSEFFFLNSSAFSFIENSFLPQLNPNIHNPNGKDHLTNTVTPLH